MFPLAHNFLIKRIMENPKYQPGKIPDSFRRDLMLVGSVFPDLAAGMGMDRDYAHNMGGELYKYCHKICPENLPFAFGVWAHGADPCGFDYYADEKWQDGKGWCFQRCTPYIDEVVRACNLPPEWGLWKAHNFVEMMAEMECAAECPDLGQNLAAAKNNEDVVQAVFGVVTEYGGAVSSQVRPVLNSIDEIFAITEVTPLALGEKYADQLVRRHGIHGGNPEHMAEILRRISRDLRGEFWEWYEQVEKLICRQLEEKTYFLLD